MLNAVNHFRIIAAVIGLMSAITSFGQDDCQIIFKDSLVCYNTTDTIYTGFSSTVKYRWTKDNDTTAISTGSSAIVTIRDTCTYHLSIYDFNDSLLCSNSVTFYTYPYRIYVDFEQISKGCPETCKSQVYATASEGYPPYRYRWFADVAPNDSSLALGLCSEETYTIRIYDTLCFFDTTYTVETFKLPDIEVLFSPDTIYLTNPRAEFSFDNKSADSIGLTNWIWIFPDSTSSNDMVASYVFKDTATMVTFVYTTEDGCIDTLTTSVPLQEFEMEIPNVFTPNGDGANERWEIPDLKKYISNEIVIFDRWGMKVFEATNYSNDWDGGRLGDGVYFYILRCYGYWKEDVYRGSVTIFGSNY